jgi:hypothetical protein
MCNWWEFTNSGQAAGVQILQDLLETTWDLLSELRYLPLCEHNPLAFTG